MKQSLFPDDKTVIELTVFAKNDLSVLYETNKGECWIRRDASTEKMTPQQIQEWARQVINQNFHENLMVVIHRKKAFPITFIKV